MPRLSTVAFLFCLVTAAFATAQPAPDPARPTLTVYGTVLASTSAATSQLAVPDVPVWALAEATRLQPPAIGGQPVPGITETGDVTDFHMTARQTRLGLRASAAAGSTAWTPSAQIEIDFFGARPSAGQGAVFNQPRLRLAVVTLRHRSGWTAVAGQDWVIFAPLNPASFSHFAVPLAASAGNPWMRLPQLRIERASSLGGDTRLVVQAGLLRPTSGGDSPAAGSLADQPSLSGERSGVPFAQGRVAVTGARLGRPQQLGVSGHYGRERVEPELVDTWGVAVDAQVALHAKAVLAGELWTGRNLDTFQAGIMQGVSIAGAASEGVAARGGWVQLSLYPTTTWTLSAGAGVDDPDIDGLSAAVVRDRNRIAWGNAFVRLHPLVTLALQYTHLDTEYRAGTGSGHHGSLGVAFAF